MAIWSANKEAQATSLDRFFGSSTESVSLTPGRLAISRPHYAVAHKGRAHPLCEAQRSKVGFSALLGFVIMFQSNYHISLFVPFLDIPVSLGNLFQRIASIDDRFYLSRLNKLFDEN